MVSAGLRAAILRGPECQHGGRKMSVCGHSFYGKRFPAVTVGERLESWKESERGRRVWDLGRQRRTRGPLSREHGKHAELKLIFQSSSFCHQCFCPIIRSGRSGRTRAPGVKDRTPAINWATYGCTWAGRGRKSSCVARSCWSSPFAMTRQLTDLRPVTKTRFVFGGCNRTASVSEIPTHVNASVSEIPTHAGGFVAVC
jgi:hypothetical protein